MNTIINSINNITSTVADTFYPVASESSDLTQRQVIMIEDAERHRRLHNPEDELQRKDNAGLASSLIKSLKFPYFALARLEGAKRMTSRAEEKERERRLYTKPEAALRKSNANRTASMIRTLGWPFYNVGATSGTTYIFADPTSLAEEEERQFRLNNPLIAQFAKNNAAFASNAIRWGFPNRPLTAQNGRRRYTRSLEERERTSRLNDQEQVFHSCQNCYNTAGLIRQLGWPFYTQVRSIPTSGQDIKALTSQEQQRRIVDFEEQRLAKEHANRISRLIPSANISLPATRDVPQISHEQGRRMSYQPASLRMDIEPSADEYRPEHFNDIDTAYEQERARLLRDTSSQRIARQQGAAKIASLIKARPAAVERTVDPMEEERLARMHDWPLQQQQMKNARLVSRFILEKDIFPSHPFQRQPHTRRYSMVPSIHRPVEPLAAPVTPIRYTNPFVHDLLEDGMYPTQHSTAATMMSAPLSAPFPAPTSVYAPSPVSMSPSVSPVPMTPSTAASSAAPTTVNRSGPGYYPAQPPIGYQAQSAYTAHHTIQTISHAAPYTTPSSSVLAPYPTSSSSVLAPSYNHIGNSYYSAAGTHSLTEQQVRRLQHQANKHEKVAEKESRKASQSAAKAEKLHMKGKDSRASKIETKVQAHSIAAKNHREWANDLLMKKQQHETGYMTAPVTGYPSM